ncbi:MAG: hypothetical protein PVH87_23820 [Desulfobacteraceae bacterium]|jgi:hypothetical protein
MQTDQLSLFDILTVKGAKIHSIYWTGSDASEKSCFDEVAHELYGTGPILFEPDERLESEMETDREAE